MVFLEKCLFLADKLLILHFQLQPARLKGKDCLFLVTEGMKQG